MKTKNQLILLLGIIAALGPLSIDLYLSGFPEIGKDLNTPINYVSLTLTAYFIGIAIGQLINGPLLDRFGRKKPLIIGVSIYVISGLGCAFAPDIYMLIALRFIMALGGSVGMVATRALIRDNFEHQEIARAFSMLILVFGTAPILAPFLGSYILANYGWRYNFVALAVYGLLILFLIIRFLKDIRGPQEDYSLKPLDIAKGYGQLIADPRFLLYALSSGFGMMAMFAYISGSPYVVREVLGFDEMNYAMVFGGNALAYIGASQVNRLILKRFEVLKTSKVVSLIFAVLGIGLAVNTALGIPSVALFLVNFLLFLSMLGFINPNLQALALEPFKAQAGSAAALIGALRMLVATLASAYISVFHDASAWPMVSLMTLSAIILLALLWYPKWQVQSSKVLPHG